MTGGVGVLISFRLYVRQVFVYTFCRDDLIVFYLVEGIVKIDAGCNSLSLSNQCHVCFKIDIMVIIYSLFFLSVGD